MAEMKPAYLVHGDDEVMLDAWRSRVRTRAASDAGSDLEVLRGDRVGGPAVADAIAALTLGVGRRWILADGVQGWKEKDLKSVTAALGRLDPDTVVVFVAHGKVERGGKGPAPAALQKAVEKAGGEVRLCAAPAARALPKWVMDQAADLGLSMNREAAEALVGLVGLDDRNRPRQQRLMRELEKLGLFVSPGEEVDRETVVALTLPDVQAKVHDMADALIEGDRRHALVLVEELRVQGEPTMHVIFGLLRKTLEARRAWALLEGGASNKDLAAAINAPPWIAKRVAEQAARADGDRLERAVHELAELDWAVRGGGKVGEEAALTLAVARAAA